MEQAFYNINSFNLNDNELLFFDIFYKNNLIYLICPIYRVNYPNFDLISIYQIIDNLQVKCELINSIIENVQEAFALLIFKPNMILDIININVIYENENKEYELNHIKTIKKYKLTLTTLCKNDYKLFNLFYDYYTNLGVEAFYIYYNGKVNENIKNTFLKNNVYLIEWDFKYFNNLDTYSYLHHAQLTQMHNALYKFGKDTTEYMIFNDLDEYFYINKNELTNLLNLNYGSYLFYNVWARTIDNNIPNKLPNNIYIHDNIIKARSKCIHKVDNIISLHVHDVRKYVNEEIIKYENNNIFYHFYNWSQPNRNIDGNFNYTTVNL